MNRTLCLTLLLVVVIVPVATAFDGSRRGFILGVGGGYHTTDIDREIGFPFPAVGIVSESRSGIATTFKIGVGISNQFTLCYVRNASWYTATDLTAAGIGGIGGSYYLSASSPSAFVLFEFGFADIVSVGNRSESETGAGYMIGGGYEFAKHFQLEATYLNGDLKSGGIDISSIQIIVTYLAY